VPSALCLLSEANNKTEGIKMTRAEQTASALNHEQMSWTDLLIEANEIADAYDQDWENEITYFEYADGSVAVFHGQDESIITFGMR
jgi:hypothetical protein